jgi:hypothetical protein
MKCFDDHINKAIYESKNFKSKKVLKDCLVKDSKLRQSNKVLLFEKIKAHGS